LGLAAYFHDHDALSYELISRVRGLEHFSESSIYDDHHIASMTVIMFDGRKEEK
jgi:hypothetical protein